jgi:hypothetical protein
MFLMVLEAEKIQEIKALTDSVSGEGPLFGL